MALNPLSLLNPVSWFGRRQSTAAQRAMARQSPDAYGATTAQVVLLPQAVDRLTHDVTRVIPRAMDILNNLILDTDELQRTTPDAYEQVYADDQISASLDNLFLPVAQAKWTLEPRGGRDSASARLVEPLRELALDVPGWTQMALEACHALVTGLRIVRPVYEVIDRPDGGRSLKACKFHLKDKRRYRPADPEWKEMYLVDSGVEQVSTYSLAGFAKPLQRDWFIVFRWRDTEDRLGWGSNRLGARLWRLRNFRVPLINLVLTMLEQFAGGVRIASVPPEATKGKSAAEQRTFLQSVADSLNSAISGNTVVLQGGVTATVTFPPGTAGETVMRVVDGYIDQQIAKTINGVTLTEEAQHVGSYALGKEHSKLAHRRQQLLADWIAEELDAQYLPQVARYNPHIFERAGVPYATPLPRLRAVVTGGDSVKEAAEIANQIKVPVFNAQYLQVAGGGMFDLATPEDVAAGVAFIPAEAGAPKAGPGDPFGMGGGMPGGKPPPFGGAAGGDDGDGNPHEQPGGRDERGGKAGGDKPAPAPAAAERRLPWWHQFPPYEPPARRRRLFNRIAQRGESWVTIGGTERDGKKHAGGTPVKIDNRTGIIKAGGPPSFKGKHVTETSKGGTAKAKERHERIGKHSDELAKQGGKGGESAGAGPEGGKLAPLPPKPDRPAPRREPDTFRPKSVKPDDSVAEKAAEGGGSPFEDFPGELPAEQPFYSDGVAAGRDALREIGGDSAAEAALMRLPVAAEAAATKPPEYWGSKDQPYWKPGPNPTVDLVVTRDNPATGAREVLLIQRGPKGAEAGKWALPGGFHDSAGGQKGEFWKPGKESARDAALRELVEETGLDAGSLADSVKPVGIYDRHGRDPRDNDAAWSVSSAFALHLTPEMAQAHVQGMDDASAAAWHPIDKVQHFRGLAFDHDEILGDAAGLTTGSATDFAPSEPAGKPPAPATRPATTPAPSREPDARDDKRNVVASQERQQRVRDAIRDGAEAVEKRSGVPRAVASAAIGIVAGLTAIAATGGVSLLALAGAGALGFALEGAIFGDLGPLPTRRRLRAWGGDRAAGADAASIGQASEIARLIAQAGVDPRAVVRALDKLLAREAPPNDPAALVALVKRAIAAASGGQRAWSKAGHRAFDESKVKRDDAGKFSSTGGGGGSSSAEVVEHDYEAPGSKTHDLTAKGKVGRVVGGALDKAAGVAKKLATQGPVAVARDAAGAVAGVATALQKKLKAPLVEAGYSEKVAGAVAWTAAGMAVNPVPLNLIALAAGVPPGIVAAMSVPGPVQAAGIVGVLRAVRDPLGTAKALADKAVAAAKKLDVVKALRKKWAKDRATQTALDELAAEHGLVDDEASYRRSKDRGEYDERAHIDGAGRVSAWLAALMQRHRKAIRDEVAEAFPAALVAVVGEVGVAPTDESEADFVAAAVEVAKAMEEEGEDGHA